jgi:hypothetical protein
MSSFQDPPGRRTVPRHFVRCAISDAGGLRRPGTRSLDRPIRPERARMSCPCPDQSSCSARIHTPSQQNAAPSKPERAMGPPNACSAGLYVEGIRRLCRAPPAVAVPGRRGTGNADGVGRPQGATLARRDGWTAPSTPRQHQQQQRPTIRAGSPRTQSGSGVSDLRCLTATGRPPPRSSSGSRSPRTAAVRCFLACHLRAIRIGFGRFLAVTHGHSRHFDLRSFLYR